MNVVGYVRVSTSEQGGSGLGLEAQRRRIRAEVKRRGWELVEVYEDVESGGKTAAKRPGLTAALDAIENGDAAGLVVAKLDRLSRSLVDFAGLVERSRRNGWTLVALDLGVDTSEPSGELMAHVIASFGQYERRVIGQRTKDALAVRRSQGVKLGRPTSLPARTRARLRRMRAAGMSYAKIAARLNEEGVPTARHGRQWFPATVRAALEVKS